MDQILTGKTVLIVEDELLTAMELERMVEEAGGRTIGPTGLLSEALRLVDGDIDVAVLDARLDNDTTAPVVEKLRARGIPFLLATGYDTTTLPEGLRNAPLLGKPYSDDAFYAAVRKYLI
ncbi:MAG TPA: response regulator [Rhizomicrobium sp.]|nr:response regulator [Rhizomicrobium sp.]